MSLRIAMQMEIAVVEMEVFGTEVFSKVGNFQKLEEVVAAL